MLFTCYDFVKPDVVIELAWKHDLADFAMPFIIQFVREYSTRLEKLEKAVHKTDEVDEEGQDMSATTGILDNGMMALPAYAGQGGLPQYAGQGMMDPNMMAGGMQGMPGQMGGGMPGQMQGAGQQYMQQGQMGGQYMQ